MMRRILAVPAAVLTLLVGMPEAGAQTFYPPLESDGYGRPPPDRSPEPRRPRPSRPQGRDYPDGRRHGGYPRPVYPGPGIGIIVGPPVVYDPPPPRVIYEDEEPPPRRRAQKPEKPRKPKPTARKSRPAPPPERPATAARPVPPPPVRPAATPDYVPDEVVFELRPDVPDSEIASVMQSFSLTPIARYDLALLGTSIQHARIARGSQAPTVVRGLAADPRVASAQLNFIFTAQEETAEPAAAQPELASVQYAPERMKIPEAHRLAGGKGVVVAVIDSAVDPAHPELVDALIDPDTTATPNVHGTGMAGAIAAHVKLVGIAPEARLLALDALRYDASGGGRGTSVDIVEALDAAASRDAQVVNLSFAGPRDALMSRALRALRLRGAVLVAAAGNAGPKAKPLFPAAHPDVIAVTATGSDDKLYDKANIGKQIDIAAPGVEVMVPAPGDAYQVTSGTSVASAHVSGIAALMLQDHPDLTPEQVRDALVSTAHDLGRKGRDDLYGAGLVDAAAAVAAADKTASAATESGQPPVPQPAPTAAAIR